MNLILDEETANSALGQVMDSMWIPKTAIVKWLSQTTTSIFFQLRTGVLVVVGDEGRAIFPQNAFLAKYEKYFECDVSKLSEFIFSSSGNEIIFQIRVNNSEPESKFSLAISLDHNVFSSNLFIEYQMCC